MVEMLEIINELVEIVRSLTQLALEIGTLVAVVLMIIHSMKQK